MHVKIEGLEPTLDNTSMQFHRQAPSSARVERGWVINSCCYMDNPIGGGRKEELTNHLMEEKGKSPKQKSRKRE